MSQSLLDGAASAVRGTRWRAVLGGLLLAASALPLTAAVATSAAAAAPPVAVSPTTGLDRAGQTVEVTLSGVPEGKGVYVQWCPTHPQGARWPSGTCASSPQLWLSSSASAQTMGATPLTGEPLDFAVTPTISGSGGTTDCLAGGCSVFVRLDHYSPGDTSLDTYVPVTFEAASPSPTTTEPSPTTTEPSPTTTEPSPTTTEPTPAAFAVQAAPTTGLDPAGDEVSVTVTGLPDDVGVYVRLCALPASGRPGADACDGQGIWVRETYPYGPFPTDGSVVKPSAGAVTLPVAASFGSVDCTTLACGVHVRRDHLGASDTSYDRAIPLTFVSATPTTTSPSPTTTSPSPTTTTPSPEISLDAGSVEPGGTLEVTASGFDAGERVVATMFSDPVELGEADADASGTVQLSLEVPADASAGEHTLQLVGQSSGVVAETTFTVAEAETTTTTEPPTTDDPTDEGTSGEDGTTGAGSNDGSLARTGSSAQTMAALGLGLAIAGIVMLAGTRRRGEHLA